MGYLIAQASALDPAEYAVQMRGSDAPLSSELLDLDVQDEA